MAHRVGIIGAGEIVRETYLPLLAKREDCELAAICSRTRGPASELATEYGIEHVYDDVHELLERSDIDTVFVCTPTETHFTIAQAALKQCKNVLIEKPLTTIYADDVRILKLARSQPNTFYVAFNNSFREENLWLSHQVQAESLGEVQIVNIDWYRALPFVSGGVLMHLGAKLLHVALGLLPDRRSFTATCQNLRRSDSSIADEDTSTSSGRYPMLSITASKTFPRNNSRKPEKSLRSPIKCVTSRRSPGRRFPRVKTVTRCPALTSSSTIDLPKYRVPPRTRMSLTCLISSRFSLSNCLILVLSLGEFARNSGLCPIRSIQCV